MTPNGHGPDGGRAPEAPRARLLSPRRAAIVLVVMLIVVVGAGVTGFLGDRGWVRIGTRDAVEVGKVTYVSNLQLFVVANGDRPLALSEHSPNIGERLRFCPSAGLFEDASGDRFDRYGVYVDGPSPRGMDRFEVRLRGGFVDVKPDAVIPGPPRGSGTPRPGTGPVCAPDGPEAPPGFYLQPAG